MRFAKFCGPSDSPQESPSRPARTSAEMTFPVSYLMRERLSKVQRQSISQTIVGHSREGVGLHIPPRAPVVTTQKSVLAYMNPKYGRGLAVASYSRISRRYASFHLGLPIHGS